MTTYLPIIATVVVAIILFWLIAEWIMGKIAAKVNRIKERRKDAKE